MSSSIELKIVSASITEMPKKLLDPMPQVWVTYEDGKRQLLFEYYPDEISFKPEDFIGLTRSEAYHLKFKKDKEYLTTPSRVVCFY